MTSNKPMPTRPSSMATNLLAVLSLFTAIHVHATLVINEFMASNGSTVSDPQGHYDDWIELYNTGPGSVDLGGMYLTDDLSDATQWRFPAGTTLGADRYLLVWADGDLLDNPNGLHADFKLSAGGEAIGLFATDGVTVVDSVSFGDQAEDVSYGRFPNGLGGWSAMDVPSPSAVNSAAMSEQVYFSRLSGVMTNNFTLKLSTPSDLGEIRYTTDGSLPTVTSTLYNDQNGIQIDDSASRRIRARAFQAGWAPGPVRTEAYLAVSSALEAFDSNLPIVLIDTFGQNLPSSTVVNGVVVNPLPTETYTAVIGTNNAAGRAAVLDAPDWMGRAGVNERGQSSAFLDKRPYKLETWDEENLDQDAAFLGLPADADWVLHNPHTDKTFMRNALVYDWSTGMGHYAPRTRFVEVFANDGGGRMGGPDTSDYLGVYVLMEKIKRGKDRVDVEKLEPTDSAEPEISGGYILKHDKDRPEDSFWTWAGRWFFVEPSDLEITPAQKNYIEDYIEEFEAVLQSGNFADPVNGYAKYIDVESFIDHDFCMEITRDVDPYRFSTYVTKERGGKLKMSPEWDYNWSMGNNDYSQWGLEYHHAIGWFHEEADDLFPEYNWHHRLKDDPEYLLKYSDRWFHLRETVLSDATVVSTIDANKALLDAEAADRNFTRWDILNTAIWPNFYYGGGLGSATHTYGMQVEWLKNWLTGEGTPAGPSEAPYYSATYSDRLGWIDANMGALTGAGAPPSFFINGAPADTGGVVASSDVLTMSGSGGEIYYTLDGTDPREAFSGNAVGTPYSAGGMSVLLGEGASCSAYIPTSAVDAAGWKDVGYNDAGWLSGTTGVGFEASPGTYDYTPLIGLDVSSMRGVNASVYIRVPFHLADADSVTSLKLKMKYDDAFVAYINGTQVASSSLAPASPTWNSSSTNWNEDANAVVFEAFDISAHMGALRDGENVLAIHGINSSVSSSDFLIVPQLETTVATAGGIPLNQTVNVRARMKNGSTWSAMNQAVFAEDRPLNNLRVSEIMYHPAGLGEAYIELQNTGGTAISLYQCAFTDGIQFTFPDRTLAAGERVLVVENLAAFEARYGAGLNVAGQFEAGSTLNPGGEEIVLRDAAGREIHDFDYNDWYPTTDGKGASLVHVDPDSTEARLWDEKRGWRPSTVLGGAPAAMDPPARADSDAVVINEILTHTDEAGGDWIELKNTTDQPIDIAGWFLSDTLDDLMKYEIAAGSVIPAGGYVVFTQSDHFGLAASDPGKRIGFGLSELGEGVYLSSGAGGALAGGFSISEHFGAALNGVTLGRHEKSVAAGRGIDFVAMAHPTMGAPNAGPAVPAVVISQIMYNPAGDQDEVEEFIELFNPGRTAVSLFDAANPSNTWRFSDGIEYAFPAGVTLAPGAHALVVRTDPDIFRHLHGVPAARAVYGPYQGSLANDGERIALSMPGTPEPTFVPYVRAEKITYSDGSHPVGADPWPTDADGGSGLALHRVNARGYGNDVANWRSALPNPLSTDLKFVEMRKTESGMVLEWDVEGVLQSTGHLSGSWTNVPGATSPHDVLLEAPAQAQFYRLN